MMIFEGERLISKMTGTIFEVKKIKDKSVVLESEEGQNQHGQIWVFCLSFLR
jgi:hypothetical protein